MSCPNWEDVCPPTHDGLKWLPQFETSMLRCSMQVLLIVFELKKVDTDTVSKRRTPI